MFGEMEGQAGSGQLGSSTVYIRRTRGRGSKQQIRQLAGIARLMAKLGEIIETPITSNL
jgi:hypothetical protein